MTAPFLSIEKLTKTFRLHMLDGLVLPAVREVSFQVDQGEFVGLAGPSGAGKSTVLKCIYRTYLATGGTILFASKQLGTVDLATLSEREVLELRRNEIGFVSQFLRVIPRVGALDLVAEPIRHRLNLPLEEARLQAAELLDRLKIPNRLFSAYPATFSGGEQQRVNIARVMVVDFPILLLDEPTASLDAENRAIVLELILAARRRGAAVLGIFHDAEARAAVATREIDFSRLAAAA
jgi:alpha-D-ribose 1-methylphosphonate 5-triphosphate synthase subunit PhnL